MFLIICNIFIAWVHDTHSFPVFPCFWQEHAFAVCICNCIVPFTPQHGLRVSNDLYPMEYCTHVSVAVCIFTETRYYTVGTCSLTCFSHLLYHMHSFVLTRTHTHTPGCRPGSRDRILEVPLSAEVYGHLIGLLCLMRSSGDYLEALKGTHEPLTMDF